MKTKRVYIKELITNLSSVEIYSIIRNEKCSFFLDSSMSHNKYGRYSYIGSNPFLTVKSKNGDIKIIKNGKVTQKKGDVFNVLKRILKENQIKNDIPIPFTGGGVGYFSYDLCHCIEKLPETAVDDLNIPDCFFNFYDNIIAVDHFDKKTYIIAQGQKEYAKDKINKLKDKILQCQKESNDEEKRNINKFPVSEIKSNFTKSEYIEAVKKIKGYIREGDVYQVNISQRFCCEIDADAFLIYKKLRSINNAPFSAYLEFDGFTVLSSSPERFIKISGRIVETRPIKGTRPRGTDEKEDIKNREELLSSRKDRAELIMIVDLERNDLGKTAETGSVKVEELITLEEYPSVFHLVSTIKGRLKPEYDGIDCIKAAFPGGSITGAPKIRAMEIIDELEPVKRNIYTGAVGYLGFNNNIDTNIVIRTMLIKDKKAYIQAGGGIVWDSVPELEYEETLHKAKALFEALRE